jgi:hypothetical protein
MRHRRRRAKNSSFSSMPSSKKSNFPLAENHSRFAPSCKNLILAKNINA